MISVDKVRKFCKEDISNIENYDNAVNDTSQTWHCHHKLEIHSDYCNSMKELKLMNLYYDRPACELIFLTKHDHRSLHAKRKKPWMTEQNKRVFTGKKPWNAGLKGVSKCSDERKQLYRTLYKGKHWRIVDGKREWY